MFLFKPEHLHTSLSLEILLACRFIYRSQRVREAEIQAVVKLHGEKANLNICFNLLQASAFQVEEDLKEQQKEKEENLKRFQGEVKQRVNQQIKMRRKQQLQKSCEAVGKTCIITSLYLL